MSAPGAVGKLWKSKACGVETSSTTSALTGSGWGAAGPARPGSDCGEHRGLGRGPLLGTCPCCECVCAALGKHMSGSVQWRCVHVYNWMEGGGKVCVCLCKHVCVDTWLEHVGVCLRGCVSTCCMSV